MHPSVHRVLLPVPCLKWNLAFSGWNFLENLFYQPSLYISGIGGKVSMDWIGFCHFETIILPLWYRKPPFLQGFWHLLSIQLAMYRPPSHMALLFKIFNTRPPIVVFTEASMGRCKSFSNLIIDILFPLIVTFWTSPSMH